MSNHDFYKAVIDACAEYRANPKKALEDAREFYIRGELGWTPEQWIEFERNILAVISSGAPIPTPRHSNAGTVWSLRAPGKCGRYSDCGSWACTESEFHGGPCHGSSYAMHGGGAQFTAANAARGFGTPTASTPTTPTKTCRWGTGSGLCGHNALQTRGGVNVCDYHADQHDLGNHSAGPVPPGWGQTLAGYYPAPAFAGGYDVSFDLGTPTDAKKCECGAAKLGTKPFAIGHASYCPVST